MRRVEIKFGKAANDIQEAINDLSLLQIDYYESNLLDKQARISVLQSKIDALQAVRQGLNASSEPWIKDDI